MPTPQQLGSTNPLADTKATNSSNNPTANTNNNGTTSDPAYSLYAGQAQSALQRALDAFNTQQGAIGHQFDTQHNQLTSALQQNQADYQNGLTQQDQTRLTNDNSIKQGGYQGYQSLMRVLGAMGAGGGSEAQYLVPQLVGQNMNQQLGGADQTAAQNKQALTSTFNNYLGQEKNQEKQLNDWKTGQLQTAQQTYNQNKANLSNILSALNSHADSAANLGSQLANQQANIPNVIDFNPTYTGATPVYQAPNLSTFEAKAPAPASVNPTAATGNATTPYLSMILGNQKKQQTA
jgi:hypothetical protein